MRTTSVLLVLAFAAGVAQAQRPVIVDTLGRQIELRLADRHYTSIRGELLAAAGDSAWVLTEGIGRVQAVPLTAVGQASVRRHNLKPMKGFLWGLGVGVVSGLALTGACNSVADADCGGVLPAFTISGALFGGLAAISYSASNHWTFTHVRADSLARFARFPQGPPPGASLEQLVRPVVDTTTAPKPH